jgi:nitroreductase
LSALGEDVPLFEAIRTARAIRRLRPDPVPPELIRKVCEAGTFAPSGGNRQPWSFVAVSEPSAARGSPSATATAFRRYAELAAEAAKAPDYSDAKRRNVRAATYLAEHLHEVPVLLFVAGWKRRGETQHQALFPCIQNVLLACRAVGLGASLTTLHVAFHAEIDAYLGLPPEQPSCAMLPIGWPLGKYGRPPRRPVDQSLYWERFDASRPAGRT